MKQILNKKTKKKGFTLIELIIVIAVIGIIAAIAVPSLMGTKETFKVKADEKSALTVSRAIELLVIDETIPVDADGTFVVTPATNGKTTVTLGDAIASNANATNIKSLLETSLQDLKKPQEKDKISYKITLTDGKVSKTETLEAEAPKATN